MITEAIGNNGMTPPESCVHPGRTGTQQMHKVDNCEWQYATSQLFDELKIGLHIYLRGLGLPPLDAEDVAQEAFFRLVRQLRTGTKIENIRAWIYHVAYNISMDIHRANRTVSMDDETPRWIHQRIIFKA